MVQFGPAVAAAGPFRTRPVIGFRPRYAFNTLTAPTVSTVKPRVSSRRPAAAAPRRIAPVMVEGHQCHRVGHAHRRLLLGKRFIATSPNGRFAEGRSAGGSLLLHKTHTGCWQHGIILSASLAAVLPLCYCMLQFAKRECVLCCAFYLDLLIFQVLLLSLGSSSAV